MIRMGGKSRLGKRIVEAIYNHVDGAPVDYVWWEPFVGGGNVIQHVQGHAYGTDADEDLIAALIAIRDNPESLPKDNTEYTEQDYKNRKPSPVAPFSYSVGGKKWGGWMRGSHGRDYVAEAYRSAQKQSPLLEFKQFYTGDYREFDFGCTEMIIYCDPPYTKTTKYESGIDHNEFYNWCSEQASRGYQVFVSEYGAPFEQIAEWGHNTTFSKQTAKKTTERLFAVC